MTSPYVSKLGYMHLVPCIFWENFGTNCLKSVLKNLLSDKKYPVLERIPVENVCTESKPKSCSLQEAREI